jgi:hypothetical protein
MQRKEGLLFVNKKKQKNLLSIGVCGLSRAQALQGE